jgi:hypothetical protein
VKKGILSVWNHRGDDQARRSVIARKMTEGAFHAALLESRRVRLPRAQRVEDETLSRVERHQLQYVSSLDRSDGDLVVEEDGPGRPRRDQPLLKAGFRKNQDLRIDVHTEAIEEAHQVARARAEIE